jgi:subtilase family serine protease
MNVKIVNSRKYENAYRMLAASPIFASVIALNNQRIATRNRPLGFLNPLLYANPDVLNDITGGSNPGCSKGTSGSIYGTLGRGSLKGLLKFLEGKKFHTCGLLSTYFLTSKCHIQPEFDDGAPLNLQTHSTHQITYLSLIWVTKPEYGNRQAHSS